MAISYKRLLKMLIDKDLTKKEFCEQTGVSYSTLRKMTRGENVQTEILETICLKMGCQLSDIAEVIPDPKPSPEKQTDDLID